MELFWEPLLSLGGGLVVVTLMVVLVAGLFRGFSGFGSGLLMAPILAHALGPMTAVPLINLLAIAASVQMVPGALKRCRWRVVLPIGIPTCLFIPVGNHLLQVVEPEVIKALISVSVLLSVVALSMGFRWRGALKKAPMIVAGMLSGVLTGIGGVGGPPLVLLLMAAGSEDEELRADLTAIFGIEILALIIAYSQQVELLLDGPTLGLTALGLPLFALGIFLGSQIFAAQEKGSSAYRRIALGFLSAVACFGLAW